MKIALIGPIHPYRGGIATFNERMAIEMQEDGHDITCYTFSMQYPSILFPGKTQFADEPAPQSLAIVRCINSINPFNWLSSARKIAKTQPDLLIVRFWLPFMGPCFGTIIRGIKRKSPNTKIICLFDNVIPHESRIGDKQFTQYFIKKLDAYICMTAQVQQQAEQVGLSLPYVVTPHPVFDNFGAIEERAIALQALNLDNTYRYLLFFGFVRAYKGLDLLLKALADQALESENIKLIIAGEYYDDKAKYEAIIAELGIADKLIQLDRFIANEEVQHLFNAADLVVQPYKTATQSGVTQVAYHFNKPMVVTNVGGLPEMCPDGKIGYVVAPKPEAIAKAIHRFYKDTDIENMIEQVKIEKVKFSWPTFTNNVYKLYESLKTKSDS